MPLLTTITTEQQITFGLWVITEEESFFLEKMALSGAEMADLASLKGQRKLEWLACRWLLHQISGHDIRIPLMKDVYAKPFFEAEEQRFCSLSHSHGVVMAMISASSCGCDLQQKVEKMARVAPRILDDQELAWCLVPERAIVEKDDLFHYYWCAKESLYKAYGKRELDFRQHIWLQPIIPEQGGVFKKIGGVVKDNYRQNYHVFGMKIEIPTMGMYYLTWCVPME